MGGSRPLSMVERKFFKDSYKGNALHSYMRPHAL